MGMFLIVALCAAFGFVLLRYFLFLFANPLIFLIMIIGAIVFYSGDKESDTRKEVATKQEAKSTKQVDKPLVQAIKEPTKTPPKVETDAEASGSAIGKFIVFSISLPFMIVTWILQALNTVLQGIISILS